MAWIDQLEHASSAIAAAGSLEDAAPWIEHRARLCHQVPPELASGEIERLAAARDLVATAYLRFQSQAGELRERAAECHHTRQFLRSLAPDDAHDPQECDWRG